MTRKDIVRMIVHNAGVHTRTAEIALEIMLESIINLELKQKLELRGVGTFERKKVKIKNRSNPFTGEGVEVSPFSTIRFKPSKHIRR